MIKVLYFAKLRERIGVADEVVTPPAEVATVADFMTWLASRDARSHAAFEQPSAIRAALDMVHAPHEAKLAGVREVAFFPPVTGG